MVTIPFLVQKEMRNPEAGLTTQKGLFIHLNRLTLAFQLLYFAAQTHTHMVLCRSDISLSLWLDTGH